jgi:sporulation protein YlmC with PRC-barrel domain
METVVDFVGKLSNIVRDSFEETKGCIGKEVIDSTAGKKGLCTDRVTNFFGTSISFLGIKYSDEELKKADKSEDVLVCQGKKGKFFVPMDDVSAVGKNLILLKSDLSLPDVEDISKKREDIFKRFYLIREALKDVLPNSIPASEDKESKKWLKKFMGE